MDRNNTSNVLAFIPARGGSKSIPLKNIRPFYGMPLIHWVISAADKCGAIGRVVLSTDSDDIARVAGDYGSPKLEVFRRSADTATDTATTESAILEYLENSEAYSDTDILILLQPTSPWTMAHHLAESLQRYEDRNFDSMLSVVDSHAFQWNARGTPLNYDYRNRPMRQKMDRIYQENGAIYINRVGNILRDGNRLSGTIGLYPMHKYTAIELDEPDDWVLAENMMRIYLEDY